jgi:hypothetical protein
MYMPYNMPANSLGVNRYPYQSPNNQNTPASGSSAPTYQQPYTDPEPLLAPRQRNRQHRGNQFAQDQISHAQFNSPGQQTPSHQPYGGQGGNPPVAPSRFPSGSPQSCQPPSPPAQQAAGFIDTVNQKYNGDIKKALFDPATRNMASSLNLVNGDTMFDTDFSKSHVDIVRQIMRDNSLDPVSKLNAVRAILNSPGKN